ncbi:MAG: DUF167 domain-containing protein [Gemmatimonadales bacterium]|nr:DUF167 domain-containing protein [Gemmatimonadales bacterium]
MPASSRDCIAGWLGDVLKVRASAPAGGGQANSAVEALLAEALGVPTPLPRTPPAASENPPLGAPRPASLRFAPPAIRHSAAGRRPAGENRASDSRTRPPSRSARPERTRPPPDPTVWR